MSALSRPEFAHDLDVRDLDSHREEALPDAAPRHFVPASEAVPDSDAQHARRTPSVIEGLELASGAADLKDEVEFTWPVSWPATLYCGDLGATCTVRDFAPEAAHLTMSDPPPVGTHVTLKFPFTVYLHGQVAWCRGDDLGLAFDPDTRRSARIVEDVLLDRLES